MFIHVNFVAIVAVVAFPTLLTIKAELSSMKLLVSLKTTARNKLLSAFGANVLSFLFILCRFESRIHVMTLTVKKEGNDLNWYNTTFLKVLRENH